MAITQDTFNGDGSNLGPFSFTFKWLKTADVKVSVNGVLKTAGTHYNLQSLNYTTRTGGQVLFTAGNAPPVGTGNIRVYRETDDTVLPSTFSSGSSIRAKDLNDNFTQNLYVAQETKNTVLGAFLPNNSVQTSMIVDGAVTSQKLGSNLTVDLASGSAATPSLTFDSNTGIYSPGEDQLALSTGGTGRLFITSAGNVGIGTASPTARLYVNGSNAVSNLIVNAGTTALSVYNDEVAGEVRLGAIDTSATNAKFLSFYTNPSGSSTGTERARIDSSGRLLVGTSSTLAVAGGSRQLQIEGTSTGQSLVTHGGTSAGSASVFVLGRSRATSNGGVTAVAQDDTLGYIQFAGANGTDFSNVAAQITAAVDGAVSGGGANDMPGRLVFSTTADGASSPTERMRISNAGTTTLTSAASTAPFIANIGASEVARIDSSGRLLVGTSSVLTGNNSGFATLQLVNSSFGSGTGAVLALGRGEAASTITAGERLGALVFTDNANGEYAIIEGQADAAAASNDYPGRLVFSTTADGASSPTERMRIKANGTINFSNVAVYADNTAAIAGGLAVGDVYRTSTGQLMIRY